MILKTIFNKPVDRPIEGVIKADDQASLRLEIEEYVLTHEVEKRLELFLDAYNNYEGANGVWISGFFGSGKSHLLKMLALVLENRPIDGVSAFDLFLPKCGDNEILRGDLKRSVAIPSKSILFNIDQKADVISKTQIDALLAVFVKVFDEMCGYYGKQGHIAQFERDLDSRDLYVGFKSAYEALASRTWEKGREQALLEANNIAKAYAQATGEDEKTAMGILDKYRSQHRLSIEDFAEQINAYIERQAKGFRLNFFVDEVGQYIAENVKLMTNLQTIAESLATKCRGRAWVIVTSQNDMTTVLGDVNKQQSNDFSKIRDRFSTRMLLTGTNVSEVIQKRLLHKTEEGAASISDLYHQQSNNFGTLFSFSDGSRAYKVYQDRDEFIRCYPFVPYQFELFQSCIENLSRHNAFEGRHTSVGERSMLAVFRQVAMQISDYEIGQLACFDLMFEGIQTALKSQMQRSVLSAQRQLTDAFAVRLLKALFLVKYVKEFKATVRNLCVLMLERFDQDLPALKKRIEEALSLLEQQTYIQRNGEFFEFLTDDEKDVEQEIKNTDVELSDVASELEALIFDGVIKHRKIRYDESGQDYAFSRKLDDRLHGREFELAIHVISPFSDANGNPNVLSAKSMGAPTELLVVMPPDDRIVRDLLMYKRTEKYIRNNVKVRDDIKRIHEEKGRHNQERHSNLKQRVSQQIGKAQMHLAGAELDIGGEDGQSRVIKGFHELVSRTYPNLRMLRGVQYSEDQIRAVLQDRQGTLFGGDATTLSEAEQELLALIQSNSRGGVRTTLKVLIERFERKPYGWAYPAVLCTLASLCARGKVEVRMDGNLLEESDLERALRNTHAHGNIVLDPQIEFTASQVRALKEFFADFFDAPPRSSEAKALGKETGQMFEDMVQELAPLATRTAEYPFLVNLKPVLETLKEVTGKPYTWYLTELPRQDDALLDMKEGVINPIRKFMSGPQKGIYDKARAFLQEQEHNFAYIASGGSSGWALKEGAHEDTVRPENLIAAMGDPACFKGSGMQDIKAMMEALDAKVRTQVQAEALKASETIQALKERLCGMDEFAALTSDQQGQITQPFHELTEAIREQALIPVVRDTLRQFEENDYQRLLSRMASWAQPAPTPDSPSAPAGAKGEPSPTPTKATAIAYVPCRTLKVPFDKAWLADEKDVDAYLASMRKALLEEISKGKRIQI